jgi:uncharacterized protein (DUF58 family)
MSANGERRLRGPRRGVRGLTETLLGAIMPTERQILTREGLVYFFGGVLLLAAGLWQQVNLILLVFTLSAGPFLASIFGGRTMLRRLSVVRRLPGYVFSGDPLVIDYTLENGRRWFASLAVFVEDSLVPVDRSITGAVSLMPKAYFARVAGGARERIRWEDQSPRRGKYRFRDLDVGTRSPFGLVEHRVTVGLSDQIVVYPTIGRLTRRWFQMQRQATENRRGQRHDRSAQQVEYHGLRDYRSGDSPRWIHWRTSARRGELMVKEFEQQNEQDLAILIDPWLPRTKASPEQREALEKAISFAATLCLETCRHHGRRLVLGWTGPAPGVRQGPASVKLLHELLEQLAMMRTATEGGLAELFDVMPPAVLREALMVVISCRPLNVIEEAERSSRLSGASARSLLGRLLLLNSAHGDLEPLFQIASASTRNILEHRLKSKVEARQSSPGQRRRDEGSGEISPTDLLRSPLDNGRAGS